MLFHNTVLLALKTPIDERPKGRKVYYQLLNLKIKFLKKIDVLVLNWLPSCCCCCYCWLAIDDLL